MRLVPWITSFKFICAALSTCCRSIFTAVRTYLCASCCKTASMRSRPGAQLQSDHAGEMTLEVVPGRGKRGPDVDFCGQRRRAYGRRSSRITRNDWAKLQDGRTTATGRIHRPNRRLPVGELHPQQRSCGGDALGEGRALALLWNGAAGKTGRTHSRRSMPICRLARKSISRAKPVPRNISPRTACANWCVISAACCPCRFGFSKGNRIRFSTATAPRGRAPTVADPKNARRCWILARTCSKRNSSM